MADIFISYSKARHKITEELAAELEAKGFSVWWDTNLVAGVTYQDAILAELDRAQAVIVIWTLASVKSKWVYSEATRADSRGVLITVREEEVNPQDIPLPFNVFHTEMLSNRAAIDRALARLGLIPKADTPNRGSGKARQKPERKPLQEVKGCQGTDRESRHEEEDSTRREESEQREAQGNPEKTSELVVTKTVDADASVGEHKGRKAPNLEAWSQKAALTHRITGITLYCSMPFLVWFLYAVSGGPYLYSFVEKFLSSFPGIFLLSACTFALVFHMLIGLYSIWLKGFTLTASGSWYWRHQQFTALANLPLTIGIAAVLFEIWGRNQAAVSQIIGSTIPALLLFLFIPSITYHMWVGIGRLIHDRIKGEQVRLWLSFANTAYSIFIVASSVFFLNRDIAAL